nr:TetR-like C-terminal domain-containing protein [uncultured Holophaga sp.]
MSGNAKRRIRDAFLGLYAKRGLKRMNIKMLCLAIPIARTTFYAHYESLEDVLAEIEDDLIGEMYRLNVGFKACDLRALADGQSLECFNATLVLIKEQAPLYRTLLGSQAEPSFAGKWKKIIKYHFLEKYRKDLPDFRYMELVTEQIACSILGAYRYWVFEEEGIAPEVMADLCCRRICLDFVEAHRPRSPTVMGQPESRASRVAHL